MNDDLAKKKKKYSDSIKQYNEENNSRMYGKLFHAVSINSHALCKIKQLSLLANYWHELASRIGVFCKASLI